MKLKIFLTAILILLAAQTELMAKDGALFEIIARQKPANIDKYFEIQRDSIEIGALEEKFILFVNLNLQLSVEAIDSQFVTFTVHYTTIGKKIENFSKRYRIEYNLPARINNVSGKNGATYQLLISPRKPVEINDSTCQYHLGQDYKLDPSANFDIYTVANSYADFNWTDIKNYIEYDYSLFKNNFNLKTSGKLNLFICPCPDKSIAWDKRFGYAIDPGRANIYALHSHQFSSVDAVLANMLVLQRNWGYAPPILVEGIAGYFEFSGYKMKKLLNSDLKLKLNDILTSNGYYSSNPVQTEVMAMSFCRFLIDQYGFSKITRLYELSDDLTIKNNFLDIYEKPLDKLETEWLHYADTLQLTRAEFDLNAARSASLKRFPDQTEYIREMTKYDKSHSDSVDTWMKLSAMYYQTGDYYEAEKGYLILQELDGNKSQYYHILGNLAMVIGEYNRAYALFDSVCIDSDHCATARLLQARIIAIQGDTLKSAEMAGKNYPAETSAIGKIEYQLFLGELYATNSQLKDSLKASRFYTDALFLSRDILPQSQDEPTIMMRLGQALLGLGQYNKAQYYLEVAHFKEIRTFYLCRTLVALGKLYDLKGDRDTALGYYRQALQGEITDFDRTECLGYMDKPYGK